MTDVISPENTEVNISGHTRGHSGALLARQPIFNRNEKLIGYELLCRSTNHDLSNAQATADVMVNAFSGVQIQDVVADKLCFINFSSDILHVLMPLVAERVVIEVLEFIRVDDEVIATVKELKSKGYLIALDDFDLNSESSKLLPFADIVKLDVLALGKELAAEYYKKIRAFGDIKLLAEKVETRDEYSYYLDMGFDYFQGYFFAKPDLIEGKRVKENKQVLMRLIGLLCDPMVDVAEVERALTVDPVLSFKILRLVNSVDVGLVGKVESINHALTMLGLERLRSWVILLSLANLSDKSHALCLKALEYAKMCEGLADAVYGKEHGKYGFSLGLFALLDAFLDTPMDEVLLSMKLSHELEQALLGREGEYGKLLAVVEAAQEGRWDDINKVFLARHRIGLDLLVRAELEAQHWADETLATISSL